MTMNLMTTLPSLALNFEDAARHLREQHPGSMIKTFYFQSGETRELPALIRRRFFDFTTDHPEALGVVVLLESVRTSCTGQDPKELLSFKFVVSLPQDQREILGTLGKGQPVHLSA